MSRRWLFADQLGPHFLDEPGQPVLLVESRAAFARRPLHRRKAHLLLSALRHRAAELGDQALLVRTRTYRDAVDQVTARTGDELSACAPTSWAARRLTGNLPGLIVRPARGFGTGEEEFAAWMDRRSGHTLLMEDFYRDARRRLGILMDGGQPTGDRWNFDTDNREPPTPDMKGHGQDRRQGMSLPAPPAVHEDDIDLQVRRDLDEWQCAGDIRLIGGDGPREFPATRAEARAALEAFVRDRLPHFGPQQDAMLAADPVMAHSLLSTSLNLGLLDPVECAHAAEDAYRAGKVPLASAEGFIRQLIGWRDYVWNLYWHFGEDYRHRNALDAGARLPAWFAELDAEAVRARCLSTALDQVREHGYAHHIIRLMVLGNYAIQRGWDPQELTGWFHASFADGYDWVMVPNVIGMSQHADGGLMASKPYLSGGAYINRMSDYCGDCHYRPSDRVGPRACPFTAGYWAFLDRHSSRFAHNPRMARQVKGLARLADLAEVRDQERDRGQDPP